MTAGPLQITADEVNCLIYAYFQDSGFSHSAFSILHEGQLQRTPYMRKHIPRGELIQLLGKALLYQEVEAHWRGDGLTRACQSGFSLLESHTCTQDPQPSTTDAAKGVTNKGASRAEGSRNTEATGTLRLRSNAVPQQPKASTSQLNTSKAPDQAGNKRKNSPVPTTGPQEKRPRREPDEMDVDPQQGALKPTGATPAVQQSLSGSSSDAQAPKKVAKPKLKPGAPADDVTDPRAVLLLSGHATEVFVCAFNPVHFDILGTGSKDAVVNIWKLPKPPQRLDAFTTSALPPISLPNLSKAAQADLTALHWSPDGELLAIGSYDSIFRICTRKGTMYLTQDYHQGPIFAVRFSKDGRWALTASLDGTAAVWDVKEKKLAQHYIVHGDCCLDVDWLTEDTFASCGADKRINVMKLGIEEPIKTFDGHQDEINQIRSNPSGTRLASCSDDRTARIWRVDNISVSVDDDAIPGLGSPAGDVVILAGHTHPVSVVQWRPKTMNGAHEIVATASFDNTARIWDSVTGECLHVFDDHRRPVYALAFSPDGQFVSTGGGDGLFIIYDMKTYEQKWVWYAGADKPGVFEIDWQMQEGVNRVVLALESRQVAVIDISKLPSLGTAEYQQARQAMLSTSSLIAPAK
ncbi:WD40 repeat-like protein [Coprinopsis sp. MPI-PUGE-AT-0042]|nr:WD40 repeat-like protein [Coprinopsis sp. MPI-PUGE-AT-0042]